MNLVEAQNAFAVRLYEWSFRDFARELHSDCPLLSMVGLNNRDVTGFVSWVKTLGPVERQALASARVRYAHEYAARLKGEALTEDEAKRWNELVYEQRAIHRHRLPPLASDDRSLPAFRPAASVSPVLGKPSRRRSSIRCTRKFGDWKIITEFTFLRRDQDLRFDYQFVRKDGAPIIGHSLAPFPPHRTLFFFYGVWDTSVAVPSHQDSEPMAKVMAKLAEYFVSQAEPLFAGLGVHDVQAGRSVPKQGTTWTATNA